MGIHERQDLTDSACADLTPQNKRLFVWMCGSGALALSAAGAVLIYLLMRHTEEVRRLLIAVLGLGAIAFLLLAGLSLVTVVIIVLSGRTLGRWGQTVRLFAVRLLLPVATLVGGMVGLGSDEVRGSFVAVNNSMVSTECSGYRTDEILLLLPRCLQWADCPHKVSQDVSRCQGCGKCAIADILTVCRERGVDAYVSTGGTQARIVVENTRPRAIVAVACEREITEGIRDVGGIPVLGVVNLRPEGPCFNTDADVHTIADAIDILSKD